MAFLMCSKPGANGVAYHTSARTGTLERVLKREQRKLSHKKKFSRNWQKQKARIGRTHSKIANISW